MRNKVRNNKGRITAVLLTLLMIWGCAGAAVWAGEIPAEETPAAETSAAETPASVESAPSDAAQPSAPEADQPEAAVQTSADSSQPDVSSTPEAEPQNVQTEDQSMPEVSSDADDAANNPAPMRAQALGAAADTAAADEEPVNEAGHKLVIDGSKRPDAVTIAFDINTDGTTTEYVYDGSAVTDMTHDTDVTDTGITIAAGSVLTVKLVSGLTKEFQQGKSPAGSKQLKLILKDKDGKVLNRLSLNNSTTQTSTALKLDDAATAVIDIAHRIQMVTGIDYFHSGSCIIANQTDTVSEFSNLYGMAGDRFVIDYSSGNYDRVDVSITDESGKSVAFSGGKFTMPSSVANLKMVYYYKAKNVGVKNLKPERGTLSVAKSQYRPGDKVVVNIKSNSGYRFHTTTLAYLYMKDGKWTAEKITKDDDGRYSFTMPFCDIEIIGSFVENGSSAVTSDPDSYIEYTDYADVDEETEEAEEAEDEELSEEEVQTMFDVTPLVSRVVAQTVLCATTGFAGM